MMRDSVVGVLCAGLFASVGSVEIVGQEERTAAEHRAVLDRYCVTCHNDRLRTGNLSLDSIDSENVSLDASTWEKVLQKMQTQSMPPPGRPRPDTETYDAFASWAQTELDNAAARAPNPGRPTMHRLNRLEYANAIRDLIGLEINSEVLLPADDLAFGFDNNADILTVAPGMMALTVIPSGPNSRARARVKPTNAAFEVM